MPMVDAKWAFIIVDVENGTVTGTDDAQQAGVYALNEDHFVIAVEGGKWIGTDGEQDDIPEAPHVDWNPDQEPEPNQEDGV